MPIITLLTDFGYQDGFVGTMKGVLLSINPAVQIIDVAHDLSPGDINSGAFVLAQSYPYFPAKTINVVIIDPGVGSARRALCVQTDKYYFVAPDNGVLKWIFKDNPEATVVELTQKKYFLENMSNTFHGRDIFAPVAAYLSKGINMSQFGNIINDYNKGSLPKYIIAKNKITGEIIYIDRFGNLISNISAKDFSREKIERVKLPRHTLYMINNSYNQLPDSQPFAIAGSHGNIEIALYNNNAANVLDYKIGTTIELYLKG